VLVPDGISEAACCYAGEGGGNDSLVAGLRIDSAGTDGSRIIFLGFGFEAVNRPSPADSLFATRSEAMAKMLAWLEGPVGAEESLENQERFPKTFSLSQNFPNPFNPATTISIDVPDNGTARCPIRLTIFDVRGRKVRILLEGELPAGRHRVVWNGRDSAGGRVASGVYLYRLDAGTSRFTRKMLMLE
jgi:hypothetical protein